MALQRPGSEPLATAEFRTSVELATVWYQYGPEQPFVLRNLTLAIRKGERVGIVGPSGSGKSTLLDLAMGLLEPTAGQVRIDGKTLASDRLPEWQQSIGHVPQHVFILDASIAENIALGVPRQSIDMGRVREAAEKAQLLELVERSAAKFDAVVGERGIRISGGERQRLGIARALYRKAGLLVLDEATSALDEHTVASVLEAMTLLGPELTILIVAHRSSAR